MKSFMIVAGCCLVVGCGSQDSAWDEELDGKAENFTDYRDKPVNIDQGYALTLGQEDIFRTQRMEIQVFTVEVLEGTHGYSLTLLADELVFLPHVVETTWQFVPDEKDLHAAVDQVKEDLGRCSAGSQDCSNDSEHLENRNLGIFEGPGKLVLAVQLTNISSYQYSIQVDEIPTIEPDEAGMLVLGWSQYSRCNHGDSFVNPLVTLPDGDRVPFAGEIITLPEHTVLYGSTFEGGSIPFPSDDTPWQYADMMVPAGTKLQFNEGACFTMDIEADLRLVGCRVTAI